MFGYRDLLPGRLEIYAVKGFLLTSMLGQALLLGLSSFRRSMSQAPWQLVAEIHHHSPHRLGDGPMGVASVLSLVAAQIVPGTDMSLFALHPSPEMLVGEAAAGLL
jgi:hypothetical protein